MLKNQYFWRMNHIIEKYFPELTPVQKEQIDQLMPLYKDWNSKINVISRKDIEGLYERHVLHSLAIAKFIRFNPGTEVVDVGTGGGFPGIPLAILFPEASFTLVDSIGKKIKVVDEVSGALGLKNVSSTNERIEKLNNSWDFIVSRAVSDLPTFYTWVKNKIRRKNYNKINNGIIYLKGGDVKEELKTIKMKKKVIPLSSWYTEEFFETKKLVYLYH